LEQWFLWYINKYFQMFSNNLFSQKTNFNFNYTINNSSINYVYEIKYVGKILSKNLSFKSHINHIYSYVRYFKTLEFIKQNCWDFLDISFLKVLYFALVHSLLEFNFTEYACKTVLWV
jgi:hypothetical protein